MRAKARGNKQRDPFGEAQEAAPSPNTASLTVHEERTSLRQSSLEYTLACVAADVGRRIETSPENL